MGAAGPARLKTGLCVAAATACLAAGLGGVARGERNQEGDLIVKLKGGISPLALPRDRLAPIAVHLEGGLQTAGKAVIPRVTHIELGLPAQGKLSTRGLPICPPRLLRDAKPPEALAACRNALVGQGRLQATVQIPNQDPFETDARLLAFNGRSDRGRAVILHAYSADPPTVAVLTFRIRRAEGRFGLALIAKLPAALGPWPRFADFELTLFRRYSYRGEARSYISASCPLPMRLNAGIVSFARMTLTVAGGRRLGLGIARGCRAR